MVDSNAIEAQPEPFREEPIHPVQIAAFKRMTAEQKLMAVAEWEFARECLATQTRTKHRTWDETAVWEEVRRRLIYGSP
jgi:hypothetical protein